MELSGEITENPKGFTGSPLPPDDVWMHGPRGNCPLRGKRETRFSGDAQSPSEERAAPGITLAVHDPQEKKESEKNLLFYSRKNMELHPCSSGKDHSCSLPVETVEELLESLMKF